MKGAAQVSFDQDEHFAYIAGYTEGGFAYGVTWEEWDQVSRLLTKKSVKSFSRTHVCRSTISLN